MQALTQKTNEIIKSCLSKGFGVSQIAQVLGVTPSAVSQAITAHKLGGSPEGGESLLEDLETKILGQLSKAQLSALNPLQLGKLFQQINGAKRRETSSPQDSSSQRVAALTLPQFIINNHVVINERNEIKEVDGVLLESYPSSQLKTLFGISHDENSPTDSSFSYSNDLIQDLEVPGLAQASEGI